MRTLPVLVVTASVAVAAASCHRGPASGASPVVDARAEFLRQVSAIASAASDKASFVDATSNAFAPTGFFAGAGPSWQRGAAGARTWLSRDSLNLTSRGRWQTVFADVSDDGRDGYSFGFLDVFRANGDSALGTFHAYWRRSDEGRWQILVMGRGRRDATRSQAPHSLIVRRREGRALVDTAVAYAEIARTEVAFSDASAADLPKAFASFAEPMAAKTDGSVYIFGREQILGFFTSQKAPPGFAGIQWKPEHGTVARSGDLGFTTGPVTSRGAPPPGPVQSGKYFTVWRRQADGTWRYVVD